MKNFVRVMCCAVAAAAISACGISGYSNGDRTGTIVKLSKKGLFCKTWEGEMAIDQMYGHDNTSFSFTVKDDKLVAQLQNALDNGAKVIVHYDQYYTTNPCAQESDYVVESVRYR